MATIRVDQGKVYIIRFPDTDEYYIKNYSSIDPRSQLSTDPKEATIFKTLKSAKTEITNLRKEEEEFEKQSRRLSSWYTGSKVSSGNKFSPRFIFNIPGYKNVEIIEMIAITEYTAYSSIPY